MKRNLLTLLLMVVPGMQSSADNDPRVKDLKNYLTTIDYLLSSDNKEKLTDEKLNIALRCWNRMARAQAHIEIKKKEK